MEMRDIINLLLENDTAGTQSPVSINDLNKVELRLIRLIKTESFENGTGNPSTNYAVDSFFLLDETYRGYKSLVTAGIMLRYKDIIIMNDKSTHWFVEYHIVPGPRFPH
jgi:hypothetical protein